MSEPETGLRVVQAPTYCIITKGLLEGRQAKHLFRAICA